MIHPLQFRTLHLPCIWDFLGFMEGHLKYSMRQRILHLPSTSNVVLPSQERFCSFDRRCFRAAVLMSVVEKMKWVLCIINTALVAFECLINAPHTVSINCDHPTPTHIC